MALETGTYISDLNASNPTAGDPKSQGDDHLRWIKAAIKATFPSLTGAMTRTQTQLNRPAGVIESLTGVNFPRTFTSADVGKAWGINAAGIGTLPLANTCMNGDTIWMLSNVNGATAVPQGGNNLYMGATPQASISLNDGKSALFVTDALNWYLIGGIR